MTQLQREIRFIDYVWAVLFQDQPLSQKWARQLAKLIIADRVSDTDVMMQIALSSLQQFEDENARAEHVLDRVVERTKKTRGRRKTGKVAK